MKKRLFAVAWRVVALLAFVASTLIATPQVAKADVYLTQGDSFSSL
jgi:hypothetical protein